MNAVIYTKQDCPWCTRAKGLMEKLNIEYVEYALDKDFDRDQFIEEFGQGSTFPRILVDGQLIGGATEFAKWLSEKNS